MTSTAKESISIRKKDYPEQKTPATTFKKVVFAHEASGGDGGFNLKNLSVPSTALNNGFIAPSAADLESTAIFFNQENVAVVSSVNGYLLNDIDYNIASNTQINLTSSYGTASAGEIFYVIVDNTPKTGFQAVDAKPLVATGELAAGATDFPVGQLFQANKFPNQQIGEVMVWVDGFLQFRNVGNAAASPSAEGNYEEVPLNTDNNFSSLIRFNSTSTSIRNIVVASTNLLVSAPDHSQQQAIERLAGQIDAIIPVLADASGQPESFFQSTPNFPDLKQFGDRVTGLEEPASPGVPLKATSTTAGAVKANDGEYTPTATAGGGASGAVGNLSQWTLQGDRVTVAFDVDIDAASAGSLAEVTIDLPVAPDANFSGGEAVGSGANDEGDGCRVFANPGTKQVTIRVTATNTGFKQYGGTFMYKLR